MQIWAILETKGNMNNPIVAFYQSEEKAENKVTHGEEVVVEVVMVHDTFHVTADQWYNKDGIFSMVVNNVTMTTALRMFHAALMSGLKENEWWEMP